MVGNSQIRSHSVVANIKDTISVKLWRHPTILQVAIKRITTPTRIVCNTPSDCIFPLEIDGTAVRIPGQLSPRRCVTPQKLSSNLRLTGDQPETLSRPRMQYRNRAPTVTASATESGQNMAKTKWIAPAFAFRPAALRHVTRHSQCPGHRWQCCTSQLSTFVCFLTTSL